MKSKDLIKLIELHGWELKRSQGSHHVFRHKDSKKIITVPHPKKDLPKGTVQQIKKIAGLL